MQINFTPIKFNNIQYRKYPKLNQLPYDTVSFTAMKKSQFKGVDLAVINMFKAPIEKFNTNEDLQNYCKNRAKEIIQKDFIARSFDTYFQRQAIIEDWCEILLNGEYKNTQIFLVLEAITRDLKKDNEKLPITLNKKTLDKTLDELNMEYIKNPKSQIGFLKLYTKNLKEELIKSTELGSDLTGWVIIPSTDEEDDDYNKNIEKLRLFSHHNWCTKSYNAEPYLKKGAMHIYFDKGIPEICIRFKYDTVHEIQGEKNNTEIPAKYLQIILKHIDGIELGKIAKREIQTAKETINMLSSLEDKIKPKTFEQLTAKEVFEMLDINVSQDENGMLAISEYKQPFEDVITFDDLGIDENRLIKNVIKIEGNADFKYSKIKKLNALREIGGDVCFSNSEIIDLGELRKISGGVDFSFSGLTDLGNLEYIGNAAFFKHSNIRDLKNLKYIGNGVILNDYITPNMLKNILK